MSGPGAMMRSSDAGIKSVSMLKSTILTSYPVFRFHQKNPKTEISPQMDADDTQIKNIDFFCPDVG
jgi:hypothetical protein